MTDHRRPTPAPSDLRAAIGDAFTRGLQAERDELRERVAALTAARESTQADLDRALGQLEDYRATLENASQRGIADRNARHRAEQARTEAVLRADAAERELGQMALVTARALLAEVRQLIGELRSERSRRAPGDVL